MRNRRVMALIAAAALALAIGGPVSAHPHTSSAAHQGDGQVLANGQNHGAYVPGFGTSCGGDPAGYGLETAHHGPDAGTPGNADGCYMTTGNVRPGLDVANPNIR